MKKLNKFFAILVSLAMMATLCVSMAFADNEVDSYDPADSYIVKYLKIDEGVTVPDDTFTFTFTQVATDTVTATDLAKDEYKALAIANVTFSAKDMTPSASTKDDGALVYAYSLEDLADMNWPKAGEYKYTVKEVLPSKTAAEGEEATQKSNGTYVPNTQEYTLRVYVENTEIKDDDGNVTGVKPTVSGITVQNESQDNDPKADPTIPDPSDDDNTDPEDDPEKKDITASNVIGFTFVNEYTQSNDEKPTGNGKYGAFYAQKNTTGTFGDKTQAFPITITVAFNDYNGDKALDLYNDAGESIASLTDSDPTASDGKGTNTWTATVNLKDGEVAYFKNLPDGAVVSVNENLTTEDAQKITNVNYYNQSTESVTGGATAVKVTDMYAADGTTAVETKDKDHPNASQITAANVKYEDKNASKANNVKVTNDSVYNPGTTGILVSNLPYIVLALVAVGGLVAYVVVRRKADDEA